MFRNTVTVILTAYLLLAAGVPVALSQEKVLSLREAIAYSMEGNPELRAAGHGLRAQGEEIRIARSYALPKLTFEERFMRTDNPTYAFMAKLNQGRFTAQDFDIHALNNPAAVNDFQTGLSFEAPLFAPKIFISIDMAKKEFSALSEGLERKKEEVAFRVLKAWLGIQTARAYVNAAAKGVEDAREHLRLAEAGYNAQLGLYSDILRARVAVSACEEKLVTANKNLSLAKRALGLMLGLRESVDATEERPAFTLNSLEYYENLLASRKDLKSLEIKRQNAGNMLRMAEAGYYPTVGVGGSIQTNDHNRPFGSEGQSWQAGAFLRWELFDGTRREHERKKALAKMAETDEYLDGLKKELSFNVYEAYLGVEEAQKGLDLARSALQAAEEGNRLVTVRYKNALSTIADLLDVQTSLDSSRAGVVERESAYLTAMANLGFQSGSILRDLGVGK